MDAQRKEAIRKLGDLKQGFAGASHPGITDAFDAAEAALVVALNGTDKLTARDLVKLMLKAVMEKGFMIMHRDEMHNALLASAQAGKILNAIPAQPERQ